VDDRYVYICDIRNDRVQILTKGNGLFVNQWVPGDLPVFHSPWVIYYDISYDMFYVGDSSGVSIFRDGVSLQRLGDVISPGKEMNSFERVLGFCIMEDQLYVSDLDNKRIQIFRETSS